MKSKAVAALCILAVGALLGGCASQVAPDDPVYQRIGELQQQVNHLQKLVRGQGLMDVASSQQQMEQELATLQGQIQDLQHQYQQSVARQQSVDQDFDRRLAALEQGASSLGIQVGGNNNGASPGSPAAAGSTGGAMPVVSGAAGTQAGGQGVSQADSAAYQAAFDKLKAGDNAAAIKAFTAFIKKYPNSRFVPNAWYWMAESHYVNGEYQDAISEFQKVLDKYPNSSKAPDSYLKIGFAQYALKDYKSATATFKAVISKYPGTTAADLARQRLKKMGAQGGQ